jgi:hypothetical protein
MSVYGQRLVAAGSVVEMRRRLRPPREGLGALLLVLAIVAIGWGLLLWLNLR